MGKDYWYWGSGSGKSSKRGGGGATTQTQIPSGCMCAFFQAFDFHPFHFSTNPQQQQQPSGIPNHHNTVPKGAEAPRNSLESEDGTVTSISKEENFKIPKIRTSGSTRGSFSDFSSEISISSPGTKTPTLVARLMGLDLLPDSHSSSSSSSSCLSTPNPHYHQNRTRQHIQIIKHRNSTDNVSTRSLPETPRMSSARRSDVEHRLSLQINKENMGLGEDLEGPRFSFSKRKYDENSCRSPSHYARQIVKQVKESVSRKVGLDITNTVKNREQGREDDINQSKFKKPTKISVKPLDETSPGKHSNQSYSPRPSRFMDTKNKPNTTKPSPIAPNYQNTKPSPSPPPMVNIEAELSRVLTKPKPQALLQKELNNPKSVQKHKKPTQIRNKPPQTSIRNKQEESFITRSPSNTRANDIKTKSKRTHPLSTNLLNNLNSTVPNLLSVKSNPSPPTIKIPQIQVKTQTQESDDIQEAKSSTQLFSSLRQSTLCTQGRNQENIISRGRSPLFPKPGSVPACTRGRTNDEDKANGVYTATGAGDEGPEYQYITTLLSRTGVHKATSLPHHHFQWFSSSHPLDPLLFHRLEHYPLSNPFASSIESYRDCKFRQKNHLGPRCNRRLMFDLVDELLSEILVRPKGKGQGKSHRGLLLETVWKRVQSFPRAKCEVLEDIDGLIELEDVQGKMKEEGEEGLVKEIEGKILEMLVHETLTVMVGGGSGGGRGGGGGGKGET